MRYQSASNQLVTLARILWTGAFAFFFVLLTFLECIHHLSLFFFLSFTLTTYSVMTVFHWILQTIFATLNRARMRRLRAHAHRAAFNPTVGLLSVGYQEDTTLLRQHFLAIRAIVPSLVNYLFISDGNEQAADAAMADVFRDVFPQSLVLNLPFVLAEAHTTQKAWLYKTIAQSPSHAICLLQPHRDKRRAMYTAMHLLCELTSSSIIMMTDSDTLLDASAVQELALPFVNPSVGAATGDVQVFNVVNWLSALSATRYWFAFNLERAAQSYWGAVSCVSGPLGAYRAEILRGVMSRWITQTFMGRRCTFGDDRHLTNLTLKAGWQVVYTPFASCKTETPTRLGRWLRQQTRWNKSFYRELLFSYRLAYKHPLWYIYDLTCQAISPLLLVVGLVLQSATIFRAESFTPILAFLVSTLIGGILRSLYGVILSKDPGKLLLAGYGFLYLVFLLPASLWALLTVWRTSWGTSARGARI